jgi:Protein of unknown function, DUF547
MPFAPPRRTLVALSFLLCLLSARFAQALEPGEMNPAPFDNLLKKYVAEGKVDYPRWKAAGTKDLDAFLDSLAAYDLTQIMGKEPKAALFINAYHAWAIRQILEHYPVKSVNDIPGFFDKNTRKVAGQERTLNDIEAALAELIPHEPEFALALSNGSLGGPRMIEEALTSDNLMKRLNDVMKDAATSKRVRYDPKTNEMHLPPQIVKYLPQYEALPNGFVGKFGGSLSLADVMAWTSKHPKIVEDPVDWSLNGLPAPARPLKGP